MDSSCLFCRILDGQVPAKIAYEDDETFAFYDIDPRAPVHVLIIPRKHIASVNGVQEDDSRTLGNLFVAAKHIAKKLGVADSGYRLVVNNGNDANQTVHHIHMHLIGGRAMKWPPG
jgi:histidine triad (HIT) family protein